MIAQKEAPAANQGQKNETSSRNENKQLRAVYDYLLSHTATATQVATALGIHRPNLCRYKRTLQKAGKLIEVRRVICPVTHFPAWAITCNLTAAESGQP